MNIYIYLKFTDSIKDFDVLVDKIKKDDDKVFVASENRRAFHVLDNLQFGIGQGDILIVKSMWSLGLNKADIAKRLDWFVTNERLLAVLDMPTTYEYGIFEPMNKAVLMTVLQGMEADKVLQIPKQPSKAGRKKIEYPDNWEEMFDAWEAGNLTSGEFLKKTGLKKATFYNLITDYRELKRYNQNLANRYNII